MRELDFQPLRATFDGEATGRQPQLLRARVPGGWLVMTRTPHNDHAIAFLPDPAHAWDGGSLPS